MSDKYKEVQSANEYPYVKGDMLFGWVCTKCSYFNKISWSSWAEYGPIDECVHCEVAHSVVEPWRWYHTQKNVMKKKDDRWKK